MKAHIKSKEIQFAIEHYGLVVYINGKDVKMKVQVELNTIAHMSCDGESKDVWNSLTQTEKNAITAVIETEFNNQ